MVDWPQKFSNSAAKQDQAPVYVLIVGNHSAPMNIDGAAYAVHTDENFSDTMAEGVPKDLFFYNESSFESVTCSDFKPENLGVSNEYDWLDGLSRGQYGTREGSFVTGDMCVEVDAVFSTYSLTGVGALEYYSYMHMPTGCGQTLLYQEGRTNIDPPRIAVQDKDSRVTKLLEVNNLVGSKCILLGGYRGFALKDFTILWTGPIKNLNYRAGLWMFELNHPLAKLNRTLFADVESFDTTLDGAINSSVTSMSVNDDTYLYQSSRDSTNPYPAEMWARFYMKMDSEWVGITAALTGSPFTITRGELGTTAASHSNGVDVDYAFGIDDNPVDIVLALMTTRPGWASDQAGGYNLDNTPDEDLGDLGAGIAGSDINFTSFETVRDHWFTGDFWRVVFDQRESIKGFIEKHFLKVMNCNFYIDKTGRLSLAIIKPPLDWENLNTLTEDDIVGTPEINFGHEDIINNIKVEYNYSYTDAEAANTYYSVDATSQKKYHRDGIINLEARGVDTSASGGGQHERYAARKMANFKNPNPVIPLEVLFNRYDIEPGEVIRVVHDNLPDVKTGKMGWDRYMAVVGKRVMWDTGTLELELIDTVYMGKRYGVISPSADFTTDYGSSTESQQDRYCFVSDSGDSNKMSDKTDGYVII
jgi:hypothetical protein